MKKKALDLFGKILMRKVRDRAIENWDMIIDRRDKGETAEMAEKLSRFQDEHTEVLRWVIPKIVDSTIHYLLWALEEEEESVYVTVETDSGIVKNIAQVSDGLCGEVYSWRARFSEQRHEEE